MLSAEAGQQGELQETQEKMHLAARNCLMQISYGKEPLENI
jgi:hypothetical protein